MAKRGVKRVGYATPNQAELSAVKTRRASGEANIVPKSEARVETTPTVRPEPKTEAPAETTPTAQPEPKTEARAETTPTPQPEPKTEAPAEAAPTVRPEPKAKPAPRAKRPAKKNIRAHVTWLASELERIKMLAAELDTEFSYLEKAIMKRASERFLSLDLEQARTDSAMLAQHLELTRADRAGGVQVNAYSDPEIISALRTKVKDPLDLITNARIVAALFRQYGLDALAELEKKAAQ